jgi:hypothetical protein
VGSVETLARRAGVRTRNVAGLELVSSGDVPALLRALRDAGVRVVGAEGFRLEGPAAVRPAMDAILDLSSIEDPEQSIAETEQFIDGNSTPDLFFEFVVRGADRR